MKKGIIRVILVGFAKPEESRKPDAGVPPGVRFLTSTDIVPEDFDEKFLSKLERVYYHSALPGPVKSDLVLIFGTKAKAVGNVSGLETWMRREIGDLSQAVGDYLVPAPLPEVPRDRGTPESNHQHIGRWNQPITWYDRHKKPT